MSKFLNFLGGIQEPVSVEPASQLPAPEPVVLETPTQESTPIVYNENATDRDGDGFVQDGTPFERPVSTTTTTTKSKKGFSID
jgi:hypothetical protein